MDGDSARVASKRRRVRDFGQSHADSVTGGDGDGGRQQVELQDIVSYAAMKVQNSLCRMDVPAKCSTQMSKAITEFASSNRIVTSAFSGMLGSEFALKQCHTSARMPLNIRNATELILYSATEVGKHQKTVIAGHSCAPMHLFDNVRGRMHSEDLAVIQYVEGKMFADVKTMRLSVSLGEVGKDEFKRWKEARGLKYRDDLFALFKRYEFKEKDDCLLHGTECFISPRRGLPDHQRLSVWMASASTTCCPWSSAASRGDFNKYLNTATVDCFAWAFSECYYEADIIEHECVVPFPFDDLVTIMTMPGLPKCVHARSGCEAEFHVSREYKAEAAVFSPEDIGAGVRRKRRFGRFCLSPFVQKSEDVMTFEEFAYVTAQTTASMYFVASQELLAKDLVHRTRDG